MRMHAGRIGSVLALVILLVGLLVPSTFAAPANWGWSSSYGAPYATQGTGVPAIGAIGITPRRRRSPAARAAVAASYYTVQPGDTLASIAAYYGTSYWYLAQLNSLPNVNCIYVGEVLRVGRGEAYGPFSHAYFHNWAQPSYTPPVTYQYPAPYVQPAPYYQAPAPSLRAAGAIWSALQCHRTGTLDGQLFYQPQYVRESLLNTAGGLHRFCLGRRPSALVWHALCKLVGELQHDGQPTGQQLRRAGCRR